MADQVKERFESDSQLQKINIRAGRAVADQVKERFESDSQLPVHFITRCDLLWLTKLKNDLKAIHNTRFWLPVALRAVADQVKERFESDSQHLIRVLNSF